MPNVKISPEAAQLLREPNPPLTNVQGKAGKRGVRKLILHKFPFSLIVKEMHQSLVIVALAHHSRKPDYWKERITP